MHVRREPVQLSDATVQPVLFTLLFVYIFGAAMVASRRRELHGVRHRRPRHDEPHHLLDGHGGRTQHRPAHRHHRPLPHVADARSSILAGRTFSDLLASLLCGTIVLLTGLVIGWRPGNGLVGVVAGLGVAVLFAYAMSWASACIGLSVSDPEAAQGIGFIVIFPLAFISTCFVPSQAMPGWMQPIAEWNPVSSVAGRVSRALRESQPGRPVELVPGATPGAHVVCLDGAAARCVRASGHPPLRAAHARLTSTGSARAEAPAGAAAGLAGSVHDRAGVIEEAHGLEPAAVVAEVERQRLCRPSRAASPT